MATKNKHLAQIEKDFPVLEKFMKGEPVDKRSLSRIETLKNLVTNYTNKTYRALDHIFEFYEIQNRNVYPNINIQQKLVRKILPPLLPYFKTGKTLFF